MAFSLKRFVCLLAPLCGTIVFAQEGNPEVAVPSVGRAESLMSSEAQSAFPPRDMEQPIGRTAPTEATPAASYVGESRPAQAPQTVIDDAPIPEARAAEPAGAREIATRLQIFLDQAQFGPGKIDGAAGEFTAKALLRYQRAHNLPENLESLEGIPVASISPIYTFYTITPEDAQRIGHIPKKLAEQAKLKRMPYPTLLKFLVERFHTDPNFLQSINPELNLSNLQVGDTVRVPNVAPFKIEEVKHVGKLPRVPEFVKGRTVIVDTKERMLDVKEGERLIASFPITPGSTSHPAPVGDWRILGIATMPWFRHDEGVLKSGVRTSNFHNIPAGPSSPVGIVWIGLNKPGIGIHGTNNPLTIGRAGSHGCIRLANWDAIRFAGLVSEGMTVKIRNGVDNFEENLKKTP